MTFQIKTLQVKEILSLLVDKSFLRIQGHRIYLLYIPIIPIRVKKKWLAGRDPHTPQKIGLVWTFSYAKKRENEVDYGVI